MKSCYIGRWLPGFHTSLQGMLSLMEVTQEAQHRAKVITFEKNMDSKLRKMLLVFHVLLFLHGNTDYEKGAANCALLKSAVAAPITFAS